MLDSFNSLRADVLTLEVRVRGTVQGVGFRPTVWRIARESGLVGSVRNDGRGVLIEVDGKRDSLSDFLARIEREAPPLARIQSIESRPVDRRLGAAEFRIDDSDVGERRTHVACDSATCPACRAEVFDPDERRYGYPFTNCTHCGPRLSIVETVPYDRCNTTMSQFAMCSQCLSEYQDPADRRFHAQPIACANCGPRIWLERRHAEGAPVCVDNPNVESCLDAVATALREGEIVAIRGLGGFHLACDATNEESVERLRRRKRRYGKPFALMATDADHVARYCDLSRDERTLLESPEAPIVLLEATGPATLPQAVAPGMGTVGFMLPYTPLHLLLVGRLDVPLVMTSGNVSDEPQIIDNDSARARLFDIADLLLLHDREIANRMDDSVTRVIGGRPRLIRRARGYSPSPIDLPEGFSGSREILAFGAQLKSTFCLVKDGAAVLSQHQGDLENVETYEDYQSNLELYTKLFGSRPEVLAVDLHPEYLSTKLAESMASSQGLDLVSVQHHHAHIASCMLDNGLAIDTPRVLGVALDGLGLGEDGKLWGGEFMLADYRSFERLGTFRPTPMIGGSQAIREPWRSTYAHVVQAVGWERLDTLPGTRGLRDFLAKRSLAIFDRMLATGLNVPRASSCGRLFDAVAAALGICRENAQFEGQGAMILEAIVDRACLRDNDPGYEFAVTTDIDSQILVLESAPMWLALFADLAAETPLSRVSARFHRGLAKAVVEMVRRTTASCIGAVTASPRVVLSGGCFQNRVLLEAVTAGLESDGFECLSHRSVPTNDGGVALGQAAIAAARHLLPAQSA